MGPKVLCVYTRLGPVEGMIIFLNIDGLSAITKLIEMGLDHQQVTKKCPEGC